jgi:hypothetical protein
MSDLIQELEAEENCHIASRNKDQIKEIVLDETQEKSQVERVFPEMPTYSVLEE